MKNKRYLNRNENGFSTILESLIAVGISVTLLTIFFYSTATLYNVQDKPEADLGAKSVGVMETLISSAGQANSSYPGWEDETEGVSGGSETMSIPRALGLGTSPTVEYGIVCINTSTGKATIISRYGASTGSIGIAETCFLAGTKVVMADGSYKNIEDITVGDIVKSYDTETGAIIDGKVSYVYHHTPEEMTDYYLVINNQLRVTPNHLVYVDGRWVEAGVLETGDSLSYQCSDHEIYSIERVFEKTFTYNFEVEGCHNYFVALEDTDALVHNMPYYFPPSAKPGGPYYGSPGNPVTFNGSGSTYWNYTGDNKIVEWCWKFYEGDTWHSYSVPTATKTYNNNGTYKVELKVRDAKGYWNINTDNWTTVDISGAPVAKFSWFDQDGLGIGTTVCFNAEKSYGTPPLYYSWDWDSNGDYDVKNITDSCKSKQFSAGTKTSNVTLKVRNQHGSNTIKQTIYINNLNLNKPTAEPWVLTSKNIYPNSSDTFLSYGAGYYVKYTDLPLESLPPSDKVYKLFEVKQKTTTRTPIIDINKTIKLSKYPLEYYDDIKNALGLETERTSYNFNITITYTNLSGGTVNIYFGPSYQNIAGIVKEETTRQVLIYNPPIVAGAPPNYNIKKPPYYLIGEITVHIFI